MNERINQSEKNLNASPRKDYLLPASILIAGIMVSGSIVYLVGNKGSGPTAIGNPKNQLANVGASAAADISSRDVILGDPKAPVLVIEYGDYQCPFCGKFFTQVESKLREEYIKAGKVKMVFKNFQFLGSESTAAGAAAECAKDQKQFWAYHDALYMAEIVDGEEGNGNLKRSLFLKLASDLKLDTAAFTSCLDGNKYAAQIVDETTKAQSAGVNSTPTTFVNTQKFNGALPYEQFKAAIDTALKIE